MVVQNGEAATLGEEELWTRKHAIESEVSVVMAGGAPGRGGRELITGVNGFNAFEGVKARFEGD